MERRGVYRKGSAGHVRNASAYRIAREHFKRWRTPITAFLVIVFVFGAVPVVGDNFQASLLTANEIVETVEKDPAAARKIVLDYMHEFVKECDRFGLKECVGTGNELIAAASDAKGDMQALLPALLGFEQKFEVSVAQAACKYDLTGVLKDIDAAQAKLTAFMDRYSATFDSASVSDVTATLQNSNKTLSAFVESCK